MKSVRFAIAALLLTGLCGGKVFSQASVETVLTHGIGSSAASTLGKTLGNALGNAAGQMGSRLGQQTSIVPRRQRLPVPPTAANGSSPTGGTAVTGVVPTSSGSLITSIQGGAPPVDSRSVGCSGGGNAPSAISSPGDAPGKPSAEKMPPPASACVLAQELGSHPAVVNLPPAK